MNLKMVLLISNGLRNSGSWAVSRSVRNRRLSMNLVGDEVTSLTFSARQRRSETRYLVSYRLVHSPDARPILEVEALPEFHVTNHSSNKPPSL
jgi:hypothetical protein